MTLTKKTAQKLKAATGVVALTVVLATGMPKQGVAVNSAPKEYGPAEIVDCAGLGTGDKTVCMASNTISCTAKPCS